MHYQVYHTIKKKIMVCRFVGERGQLMLLMVRKNALKAKKIMGRCFRVES